MPWLPIFYVIHHRYILVSYRIPWCYLSSVFPFVNVDYLITKTTTVAAAVVSFYIKLKGNFINNRIILLAANIKKDS